MQIDLSVLRRYKPLFYGNKAAFAASAMTFSRFENRLLLVGSHHPAAKRN
jgi:hypothetical protein